MTALAMIIGMLPMALALAKAASRMLRWAAR
jgi:multidrug efflux pump subunit AcrB